MYTLSDILAVINFYLEFERKQRNLEARGHLSLKRYKMMEGEGLVLGTIIYFFIDADHNYPLIRMQYTISKKQLKYREEEFHKYDMMVLKTLWKLLGFGYREFAYEKLVDGTFNYTQVVE